MSPERPAIWNRDFTLLWVTNFLMATSFYFLLPTVPAFATDILRADKSQVGYLIGIFTVAALAIRPLAGYLLDVRGRKAVYLGGLSLFALFVFSYQAASVFLLLLVVRFLHGLSWGVLTTGGSTVAADLLPGERRGEGLGYYGMTMTLAMAFGPLLGLQIAGDGLYGRLFFAAGALAAVAALMGALIRYPTVKPSGRSLSVDSFLDRRVLPVAGIALVGMMSYGGVVSFLTLFTQERGLNAGLFFLVYAVAMSIARPFAGRLLDRRGPTLTLSGGLLMLMAGFVVLGMTQTTPLFALAAVLLGVGNGNVFPTLQAMAINLVEPQRRGVASSTLFSGIDLGIGLGSTVLGWVADAAGLAAMYTASGLILLAPLAWFLLYVRRYYAGKVAQHGPTA
ncbi:MAG: MFS transporter [Bacillota bacterium]